MSNNLANNENKSSTSLSTLLIIGVTVLLIVLAIIVSKINSNKKEDVPSAVNSNPVVTQAQNIPDATRGDSKAKLDTTITFRDIKFDMSIDDIKALEEKNEDTLSDPTISKSGDGYTYIYYTSNPDKPLSFNKINVGTENAPGLTYVFNADSLEEARLQFGAIDEASYNSLLSTIKGLYGESTFYRATNGTESYWWNTDKSLLMLSRDSYSTTLFFRRN